MQHGHVLKKFIFDLFIPSARVVGEGGSVGKIATMLLHFVIHFNLICNMTMF